MVDSVPDKAVRSAVAPYTSAFLMVYDFWVIRLSNSYAWRCAASSLLAMYRQYLGRRHLEVGPGSGWYLVNAEFPVDRPQITLMDLNRTPLEFTRRRLGERGEVTVVAGSVLDPVPVEVGVGYDSIGLNFVMHCVPGDFTSKGVAFAHLSRVLADDGVLFGSTILGPDSGRGTVFGRTLRWFYSRVGAFNNSGDARHGLEAALSGAFAEIVVSQVGEVTTFTARCPRR